MKERRIGIVLRSRSKWPGNAHPRAACARDPARSRLMASFSGPVLHGRGGGAETRGPRVQGLPRARASTRPLPVSSGTRTPLGEDVGEMRTRLLRRDDGATMVFVYPATKEEYGRALAALERPGARAGRGGADAGRRGDRRAESGAWVVTTAAQRERWGLADLAAAGRVRVVDEQKALGLLGKGAVGPVVADEPPAGAAAPPGDGGSGTAALEALRALVAPDARVEQALADLQVGELPDAVGKKLGRALRRALRSQAKALEEVLGPGRPGPVPAVAEARGGAVRPRAGRAGAGP